MDRFFVSPGQIEGDTLTLKGQAYNHLKNVLRYRPGDEVLISDGEGLDYDCVVQDLAPGGEAVLSIRQVQKGDTELPVRLVLFQALPKADKMDLIIQKAVELGAAAILPVATSRCVVRLDEKKAEKKIERWQAIAEGAAGQCGRSVIPRVGPLLSFEEALKALEEMDLGLMPYERAGGMEATRELLATIRPGQRVGILIGPEGGFEEAEVKRARDRGIRVITLGRRILRTETAGLALLAHLMLILDGIEEAKAEEAEATAKEATAEETIAEEETEKVAGTGPKAREEGRREE